MAMRAALACGVLALGAHASSSPPEAAMPGVVDLTTANWDESIVSPDRAAIIEFYAPWCGWCKRLSPVWSELGKLVESSGAPVTIGKFDATQGDSAHLKTKFGVRGFPTIIFLAKGDMDNGVKYTGKRNIEDFLGYLKDKAGVDIAKDGSSFTTVDPAAAEEAKPESESSAQAAPSGPVAVLTPDNFDDVVLKSDRDVFVKFYAPWCGHCQRMVPAWEELAKSYGEGGPVVAKLDAAAHRSMATRFGVRGFPTLKLFKKGQKDDPVAYSGGRDAASLKKWLDKMATPSE